MTFGTLPSSRIIIRVSKSRLDGCLLNDYKSTLILCVSSYYHTSFGIHAGRVFTKETDTRN